MCILYVCMCVCLSLSMFVCVSSRLHLYVLLLLSGKEITDDKEMSENSFGLLVSSPCHSPPLSVYYIILRSTTTTLLRLLLLVEYSLPLTIYN